MARRQGSQTESVAEAARRLGADERTVRRMWIEGRLRGFSTGHGIRINSASVDELMNGTGQDVNPS